jgi:hypothetical protein
MRPTPCPAVGLSLLAVTFAAAADRPRPSFPPVDQLPARPELPDPLVMLNGERVTTKEQWFDRRRPELKNLFQHYMYGYFPPKPEKVVGTVEREDRQALGGKATLREISVRVGPPEVPAINLLLVVPNNRKGPAPVFVGLNFVGNHALLTDPAVRLPAAPAGRAPAARGSQVDVWALDQSVDRGYAVATFHTGDVDPDRAEVRGGLQPYLRKQAGSHGPNDWGTIAAWAWGISRAVDYLVTDPDIDPKRIASVGHSRLGKTAILAAAFDDRIALAVPLQAGCGGTAPSRGTVGESVTRINTSFPHWFDAAFKEFNDRPDRLPFDQNGLVALCAPRPVLFANATEDTWANPAGQFEVLKAADPVYRFLGAGGLEAERMPEPGRLADGTLGYYIRPGKHSMTRGDWKVFLDFADRHLTGGR